MLQLSCRWVRSNQHVSPTNGLSESNCGSKRTDIEVSPGTGGVKQRLVIEPLRLAEKKKDIFIRTYSESEMTLSNG